MFFNLPNLFQHYFEKILFGLYLNSFYFRFLKLKIVCMETYAKVAAELQAVKDKRKKMIEDALDGRTQDWLANKLGMNNTRLSHCINGLMEFSTEELDGINKYLGTDFQLNVNLER